MLIRERLPLRLEEVLVRTLAPQLKNKRKLKEEILKLGLRESSLNSMKLLLERKNNMLTWLSIEEACLIISTILFME
jgi:hypothetical protein